MVNTVRRTYEDLSSQTDPERQLNLKLTYFNKNRSFTLVEV